VRLLIGDRKKSVTRELVTPSNDGIQTVFQLDMYPIASGNGVAGSSATASFKFYSSGTLVSNTGTLTLSGEIGRYTLGAAITAGEANYVNYSYYALTSGELSDILSGHTGQPYLAAANACLVLAADTSRHFSYTMGEKIIDKRQVPVNLRELADSLFERHNEMIKKSGYTATVTTFKDDTGTPYYGYDTAVAYLTGTS